MKHREDELSIYSYLYLADYMYMYMYVARRRPSATMRIQTRFRLLTLQSLHRDDNKI